MHDGYMGQKLQIWDNPGDFRSTKYSSYMFVTVTHHIHGTKGVVAPKSATADNCFSLIGFHQCNAALGGPATSNKGTMGLKMARDVQSNY